MKTLLRTARLLRVGNLALVAITPPALWSALVKPLLATPQLTQHHLVLLGLALAAVTGAGNVVNDIADRTIDRLNGRPNPLLEGLPVGVAWGLFGLLTLTGAILTWQLAAELDRWAWAPLLPLTLLTLVGYAYALKCQPWVGNLVVSVLCAGVPALIFVAEPALRDSFPHSPLAQTLAAYVVFAFFGTWTRELVKDLEDRSGDAAAGCRTLAVAWPRERVIAVAWASLFFLLSAIAYLAAVWYLSNALTNALCWAGLWLLVAAIGRSMSLAREPRAYAQVSRHLKLAMGFGLFLVILVAISQWRSF